MQEIKPANYLDLDTIGSVVENAGSLSWELYRNLSFIRFINMMPTLIQDQRESFKDFLKKVILPTSRILLQDCKTSNNVEQKGSLSDLCWECFFLLVREVGPIDKQEDNRDQEIRAILQELLQALSARFNQLGACNTLAQEKLIRLFLLSHYFYGSEKESLLAPYNILAGCIGFPRLGKGSVTDDLKTLQLPLEFAIKAQRLGQCNSHAMRMSKVLGLTEQKESEPLTPVALGWLEEQLKRSIGNDITNRDCVCDIRCLALLIPQPEGLAILQEILCSVDKLLLSYLLQMDNGKPLFDDCIFDKKVLTRYYSMLVSLMALKMQECQWELASTIVAGISTSYKIPIDDFINLFYGESAVLTAVSSGEIEWSASRETLSNLCKLVRRQQGERFNHDQSKMHSGSPLPELRAYSILCHFIPSDSNDNTSSICEYKKLVELDQCAREMLEQVGSSMTLQPAAMSLQYLVKSFYLVEHPPTQRLTVLRDIQEQLQVAQQQAVEFQNDREIIENIAKPFISDEQMDMDIESITAGISARYALSPAGQAASSSPTEKILKLAKQLRSFHIAQVVNPLGYTKFSSYLTPETEQQIWGKLTTALNNIQGPVTDEKSSQALGELLWLLLDESLSDQLNLERVTLLLDKGASLSITHQGKQVSAIEKVVSILEQKSKSISEQRTKCKEEEIKKEIRENIGSLQKLTQAALTRAEKLLGSQKVTSGKQLITQIEGVKQRLSSLHIQVGTPTSSTSGTGLLSRAQQFFQPSKGNEANANSEPQGMSAATQQPRK